MAPPALIRVLSVPVPLDVPGPVDWPLSENEMVVALTRTPSTPVAGDDQLRIPEMFIVVKEMNGTTYELGYFRQEETVGEIKRETSKEIRVPGRALKIATDSSSLDNEEMTLGEVWQPLTPGANLIAVLQIPPEYEETLKRLDDIRVHEDAYKQLVNLACEFKEVTSANVNVSQRIILVIKSALAQATHNLSRTWAIAALTKLLKHLIEQMRQEKCLEDLKFAIQTIGAVFVDLSDSERWLEREAADEALTQIRAAGVKIFYSGGTEIVGMRPRVGGA